MNTTQLNTFEVGQTYNAAQKISRFALSNGHAPLYYSGLIYIGYDTETKEHMFDYEGETKWFDDEFINNKYSEDNSMTIIINSNN